MTEKQRFSKIPFYIVSFLFAFVVLGPVFFSERYEDTAMTVPYPACVTRALVIVHGLLLLYFLIAMLFGAFKKKGKTYIIHNMRLFVGCLFSFVVFYLINSVCSQIS